MLDKVAAMIGPGLLDGLLGIRPFGGGLSGAGGDISPPDAPTGLTATAVSASQIDLAWNASDGATGYEIERGVNGVDFVLIDTVGAVVAYENTGLSGGTYYYRIRATNAVGDSDYSNIASAITLATYIVTTTGAQTHTINSFGVAVGETVTIDWGDGSTSDYTGTAQRTHNYAGAGDWTVMIYTPDHVRTFDIRDNKVTLNSADIKNMSGVTTAIFVALKAGTFNSADVTAWRPTTFGIISMPAAWAGTFNSADLVDWRPTAFFGFYLMASTACVGVFDSADVADWNPADFRVYGKPAGYTVAITANGFAGFTTCTLFQMQDNGLLQAAVNTILYDLHQASIAPRTATGGIINVGGSNAVPSGTFQAAASCPVTGATPGQEVAHELLNDTCGAFANHWTTVTF